MALAPSSVKDKLAIDIDVKIERGQDNPVTFVLLTSGSATAEWEWPAQFDPTALDKTASMKLTGERWSWGHQAVHSCWKNAASCASTGTLIAPLEALDDNPGSKADSVRELQVINSRYIRYLHRPDLDLSLEF